MEKALDLSEHFPEFPEVRERERERKREKERAVKACNLKDKKKSRFFI